MMKYLLAQTNTNWLVIWQFNIWLKTGLHDLQRIVVAVVGKDLAPGGGY